MRVYKFAYHASGVFDTRCLISKGIELSNYLYTPTEIKNNQQINLLTSKNFPKKKPPPCEDGFSIFQLYSLFHSKLFAHNTY
jgi:hypothetical protein